MAISESEFLAKYRSRLRGFAVIGFTTRRTPPSEIGQEHDVAMRELELILRDMWSDLQHALVERAVPPMPVTNGSPPKQVERARK